MQTADILTFPAPSTPLPPIAAQRRPAPAPLARTARDIGLAEIAHRLGLDRYEAATIVKHLRNLALASGFPLPRTTRFWRGAEVTGPRLIVANAVWHRFEVDQWFEDRDPPATRAARQRNRQAALRDEMKGRAAIVAAPNRIAAKRRQAGG